ncbi:MAG: hypothetical protein ACI4D8_09160 [Wujia sp.]
MYVFMGMFFATVGSLIVSFVEYAKLPDSIKDGSASLSMNDILTSDSVLLTSSLDTFMLEGIVGGAYLTHYLMIGIFLGFALIHSDSIVLLYFLIPFKVKWLAYIDVIFMGVEFATSSNPYNRVIIVSYLLVFLIMTTLVKNYHVSRRHVAVKMKRKKTGHGEERGQVINMPTNNSTITRHKCAVCGRTERDGDDLEFRFCSKCNGNYEYCNEHLYTHEHIK